MLCVALGEAHVEGTNSQQGTVVLYPKATEEPEPANSYVNDLEVDRSSVEPLKGTTAVADRLIVVL